MEILQEGPEALPRCDKCGVNMTADRLFKQRWAGRCNKATDRRLRRRDVEMAERCGEM